MTLYRVIWKTTPEYMGFDTHWNRRVLYCGTDRDEARAAFHKSRVDDYDLGDGGSRQQTYCETIADAGTEDFADDEIKSTDL